MTPRVCPVDSCERPVRAGHLMCGSCWQWVPIAVQREVYRTWARYQRDSSDENFTAYSAARDKALAAVP